jgi:hypothetical protein
MSSRSSSSNREAVRCQVTAHHSLAFRVAAHPLWQKDVAMARSSGNCRCWSFFVPNHPIIAGNQMTRLIPISIFLLPFFCPSEESFWLQARMWIAELVQCSPQQQSWCRHGTNLRNFTQRDWLFSEISRNQMWSPFCRTSTAASPECIQCSLFIADRYEKVMERVHAMGQFFRSAAMSMQHCSRTMFDVPRTAPCRCHGQGFYKLHIVERSGWRYIKRNKAIWPLPYLEDHLSSRLVSGSKPGNGKFTIET